MKLKAYLSDNQITYAAFGQRISVTGEAVRKYAEGLRIPRAAIMPRIVRATKGAVGPADFFETSTGAATSEAA
jgi:hypothetical protein